MYLGFALLLLLPTHSAPSVAFASALPLSPQTSSSGQLPDSTKLEFLQGDKAIYPPAARAKKMQGTVWLRLDISESGDVVDTEVLSGDPILTDAAIKAARTWKFKPFIRDGHAVSVSRKFPFDFAFRQNVRDTSAQVTEPVNSNPSTKTSTTGESSPGAAPVQLSTEQAAPLLLHKVQPVYPEEARRNRIQGTVLLRAMIDRTGRVTNLEAISGPKELTAPAIAAVEQWRYRPYMVQEAPVEVETKISVQFDLQQP